MALVILIKFTLGRCCLLAKVWLNQDNQNMDITNYTKNITWRGSKSEASRSLEINLINSVLDLNIPDIYIKNGSILKLFEDTGELLFKGYVFKNERASQSSSVSVTAYDPLIYFLKSVGTYNVKNKTAEEVARMLCNDFEVPVGTFAQTGVKQSFLANRKGIYDILAMAYTTASKKNGKKYMPLIKDGKLNVIEIGTLVAGFELSDEINIIDSGYTESIENMVNRVRIYNDGDTQTGVVENAEWIKKYGVLQDIYVTQKDKDTQIEAKSLLTDVEKAINVEAIGNIRCITGNAVKVKDKATGLTGLFYIDSDTHTWSNGQHIMKLKLNFKNIMDEKE